jgi:hypothetical protein
VATAPRSANKQCSRSDRGLHRPVEHKRTASNGLVWSNMRTALGLSLGIFVIVASGLVIALMRRRSPLDDLDAVSGQWIAERSKLDQ